MSIRFLLTLSAFALALLPGCSAGMNGFAQPRPAPSPFGCPATGGEAMIWLMQLHDGLNLTMEQEVVWMDYVNAFERLNENRWRTGGVSVGDYAQPHLQNDYQRATDALYRSLSPDQKIVATAFDCSPFIP